MADATQDERLGGDPAETRALRLNNLHVAFEGRDFAELLLWDGNALVAPRNDENVHDRPLEKTVYAYS